jgi:ADP-ribose pyrophosphatase YjhB (NUDIX family)
MCGRYPQPNLGAAALIERDGKLLLLRRAHAPFEALWNLPAGFVEPHESPAEAAVRETREETGASVEPLAIDDAYYFDDDPRGEGVLIVYRCRIVSGEPSPSPEASEARFFAPSEVPAQLAGGGHNLAILAWRDRQQQQARRNFEEAGRP